MSKPRYGVFFFPQSGAQIGSKDPSYTLAICLRQMAACNPDVIVYNNLLAVYQQKQDWQSATSALKEMASLKGLRPDVVGALAFANG